MSFIATSFKAPVILDGGWRGSHSKMFAPVNSYDWVGGAVVGGTVVQLPRRLKSKSKNW